MGDTRSVFTAQMRIYSRPSATSQPRLLSIHPKGTSYIYYVCTLPVHRVSVAIRFSYCAFSIVKLLIQIRILITATLWRRNQMLDPSSSNRVAGNSITYQYSFLSMMYVGIENTTTDNSYNRRYVIQVSSYSIVCVHTDSPYTWYLRLRSMTESINVRYRLPVFSLISQYNRLLFI